MKRDNELLKYPIVHKYGKKLLNDESHIVYDERD